MASPQGDGSIKLKVDVDTKGITSFTAGLKSLAKQLGIAFSIKAIVDFSKAASDMAMKTEASVQRLVDIYGEASQEVGNFIDENANALGMSKAAASSFSAVYGNLFSVWADQATNAKLTNAYLNQTAVIASKTGRTVEDVQERIRSGLLGNTEAIEDLGVFVNVKTIEMTDAFQRMANGKSWEQLDAYTQQQIRSMAILEQSMDKYGTKVSDTSILTKNQLNAAYQDFQNTWGQIVNMVLLPIMKWATTALTYLNGVLQGLFGIAGATIKQGDAINSAVGGQKKLTDEVKKTGKAQEKNLAGFDELNILQSNTEESTGAEGATGAGVSISDIPDFGSQIDTEKLAEGVALGERLREVFQPLINIFNWLSDSLGNFGAVVVIVVGALLGFFILKKILGWLLGMQSPVKNVGQGFGVFLDKLGNAGVAIAILGGLAIAINSVSNLLTAFSESGLSTGEAVILIVATIGALVGAFALLVKVMESMTKLSWTNLAKGMIVLAGFVALLLSMAEVIKAFSQTSASAAEIGGVLATIFVSIIALITALTIAAQFLQNPMAMAGVVVILAAVVAILITLAITLPPILEAVEKFTVAVAPYVILAIDTILKGIIEITRVLGEVLPPIIEATGNVFSKIFDGISKIIKTVGDSMVKMLQEGIAGTIERVLKAILNFTNKAGPAINNFVDGIIKAVTKLINFVISGIEYMVNRLVIDGVNGIIKGINSIGKYVGFTIPNVPAFTIPRFVPKLAKGAVIPPNKEFMAVLGDQKHGRNLEAPEDLIRQIVREEAQAPTNFTVKATGSMAQLIRLLNLEITQEQNRASVF